MERKAKKKLSSAPVVYTANRLRDGRVVWFAKQDRWTEELAEARLFEGDAIEEGLALAQVAERQQFVVGVYGIDVASTDRGFVPLLQRERIRAAGPSVRADLVPQRQAA
jgi:hypothetical protein